MGGDVTAWWVSHFLCLALSSPFLFLSFFLFFLRFWLLCLVLGSYWLLGFLLLLLLLLLLPFFFFFTYIYFKVFMGSWKLLGWPIGIGMVEVRGARVKNRGGQSLFLKILHTKKKNFWTQGGLGPPLPSTWVHPWVQIQLFLIDLEGGIVFWT